MDYFIDHANYEDKEIYFPNVGKIRIKRGQHIFGSQKLSEYLGVSRQRIRSKLARLKQLNFLTIQSTNRYSIATVLNYKKYNPTKNEINQQKNQQLTTPKEVNNIDTSINNFILPTKEEIKESSQKKIKEDLQKICDELYTKNVFIDAHKFKNTMLKRKINPRALLHTLIRCYIKQSFKKDNPWGYCLEILKVEDGNYNEVDFRKTKKTSN
jgi:hypothetical protein